MMKYIFILLATLLFNTNVVFAEDYADIDSFIQEGDELLDDADFIDDSFMDDEQYSEEPKPAIYVDKQEGSISTTEKPVLVRTQIPTLQLPKDAGSNALSPPPPPPSFYNPNTTGVVDKNVSLTGMFEDDTSPSVETVGKDETWLDRLRSGAEKEIKSDSGKQKTSSESKEEMGPAEDALKSLVDTTKKDPNRKSNASVFNVSGAMLRMTPKQIDEVLTRRGYRKTNEKIEIPNFIKWRKEEECRASGVIGYERIAGCVLKAAKAENYQFVEQVNYEKYDSKESMSIKFTSSFTGNKAYKIYYTTAAANIKGNSQKAIYMRNIKVYDFWKQISRKYGAPDNKEEVIWGLGGNNSYLQARTGKLLLEDPMLIELDYTRMSREDQKFMNTGIYNF